ncbi:hypothetical protein DIPPA_05354 [Diplonema papillatum]|nr:hypothetical protein DIPPA_05354 [Diplonema papillatum]
MLTVTNGSGDAASFKIRLTHPSNSTAKGDLAPGESAPLKVATAVSYRVQKLLLIRCGDFRLFLGLPKVGLPRGENGRSPSASRRDECRLPAVGLRRVFDESQSEHSES